MSRVQRTLLCTDAELFELTLCPRAALHRDDDCPWVPWVAFDEPFLGLQLVARCGLLSVMLLTHSRANFLDAQEPSCSWYCSS